MPPRLNLIGASRPLALRSRLSIASHQPRIATMVPRRGYANEKDTNQPTGPNQGGGIGHVSEEAADMSNVTGGTGPDLGQGTPVQEILERDEESKEKAPEIIKEEMGTSKASAVESTNTKNQYALGQMENIALGGHGFDPVGEGHKFGLPDLPIPPRANLHHRYEPVISQVTNLLMKHGKLSVAQRNMSFILNHLRTSPPPVPNPARPLIPGAPPPSHLPLNPIAYLELALDSVAPILRIRTQKGAAGGGASLQIPVPLGVRQRRRTAVEWIFKAIEKKASRGSGRKMFAQRFAEEIISIVEGKSGVWDRRMLIHKSGTMARTNMNLRLLSRKGQNKT